MKPIVALIIVCLTTFAHAQNLAGRFLGGGVNLPYQQQDGMGNQWMIYQGGWLQQQGMNPVYSQGAMLTINGQTPQNRTNRARMDDKTGELVIDEMSCSGLMVSRRIFFSKEEPQVVRFVDVLRNPTQQEVKVNLSLQTTVNYNIQTSQTVSDPKRKEQSIGWVAQTGNGRCVLELFAGKGTKTGPNLNYVQGANDVNVQMPLTIPAGKTVAFLHFHGMANSIEQGTNWINNLKEAKLLASLPKDMRKLLVNFGTTGSFVGDIELLRGDLQDVVELRGGDQLKGTVKDASFKLVTSFGEVNLPTAGVLGMVNVGQFRPRQLVVTNDGQIFGGTLSKQTIDLELASGQVTQIPLAQINRVGTRKGANEPEEIAAAGAFVQLRSGDRVSIEPPEKPIEVVTRYGKLSLAPESVAAVQFQVEEHGVHEVNLTDGSKFAGLIASEAFDLKLVTGGNNVSFPASSIHRLQLQRTEEQPDGVATLKLINGDLLVGTLDGQMKLDTAFDTITINGAELRSLSHPKESSSDVQVTLWDQTTMTGTLQAPTIQCKLTSGPTISVPPALIDLYNQPLPRPSRSTVDKIKALVADLNADDWKQRDRAEAELTQMGVAVTGVLKEVRAAQSPESQQRIDSILKQLQKTTAKAGGGRE